LYAAESAVLHADKHGKQEHAWLAAAYVDEAIAVTRKYSKWIVANISKEADEWIPCLSNRFNELIDDRAMERNCRIADKQNKRHQIIRS
jgi:hypothetical protein